MAGRNAGLDSADQVRKGMAGLRQGIVNWGKPTGAARRRAIVWAVRSAEGHAAAYPVAKLLALGFPERGHSQAPLAVLAGLRMSPLVRLRDLKPARREELARDLERRWLDAPR